MSVGGWWYDETKPGVVESMKGVLLNQHEETNQESGSQVVQRCDVGSPLIIIGAGRSGTTLVMKMLDAHPAMSMRGETKFLVPRMWSIVWEERFWHFWKSYVETGPTSSKDPRPEIPPDSLSEEEKRVGRLVAEFTADLLEIEPDCPVWGFKEIWNGTTADDHSWLLYDTVFPGATWLHVVRHPFDFAGSCTAWNRTETSPKSMSKLLHKWMQILNRSRERQEVDRFFEIRYEDVCDRPRETLRPVFQAVGLEWDEQCCRSLIDRHLPSQRDAQRERDILAHADLVRPDGFDELAVSLGYELGG